MSTNISLNAQAAALLPHETAVLANLRIHELHRSTARILDFGVDAQGGLAAGLLLARICMSDLASVSLGPASNWLDVPQVFVTTDHPVPSCLLSQYAGWKIGTDNFFGMGSGPMRALAGSEELFQEFPHTESAETAVGCLEAGSLPTESAIAAIRKDLPPNCGLLLAVAPTASQAGNLQVVARSVETAMHKLHEIGFPVEYVVSGSGAAPLPPVAADDLTGIGRTNDSILYGATVNLHVDADDELIKEFGPQTPSCSSESHGQSFLSLFKAANCDFYALDKALFSPAVVVFHSLKSGNSFRYGTHERDLVATSFGLAAL